MSAADTQLMRTLVGATGGVIPMAGGSALGSSTNTSTCWDTEPPSSSVTVTWTEYTPGTTKAWAAVQLPAPFSSLTDPACSPSDGSPQLTEHVCVSAGPASVN